MKRVSIISLVLCLMVSVVTDAQQTLSHKDVIRQLGAAGALHNIITSRVVRVGVSPGFIPFEFRTNPKNTKEPLIGFDIDIAKKMAQHLNAELVLKECEWANIIRLLKDGEIDIIISGMTRTLDRALEVNFTEPYFETGQVILLAEKNKDISDYRVLNKKGVKIAVVEDTTGKKEAEKKFSQARIEEYKSEPEALKALLANQVDAFVIDKPYAEVAATKYTQIKLLPEQLTLEKYCFAIQKTDLDFLLWLNYFIDELKYTGEYDKLYTYWFIDESWKKK